MRQEVQATVIITYDANARLSKAKLRAEISDDLARLLDADSGSAVEATDIRIVDVKEESAIYQTA